MATYTVTTTFTVDTTAVASEVNQNFTDVLTALNSFDAANLLSGTVPLARISGLTTTQLAAATLVTEAEGLASSDNDTSWGSTAAVIDYVDTQVAVVDDDAFGTWTNLDSLSAALAVDETYKVGSDGFVTAEGLGGPGFTSWEAKTDGSSPPTTIRYNIYGVATTHMGVTIPVKKDDYWRITTVNAAATSVNIYWLPIGSGTSVKQ